MSKRILALGALVVSASLVLVGCGASSNPKSAQTDAPKGKQATSLTEVIGSDPDTLNPALSSAPNNRIVGCMFYQGLTRVDKDYKAQPQLAKKWTVSPDGKLYTFQLQEAKWSDGQKLTAEDVVYSLTQVAKLSPSFAAASAAIESVKAVSASSVEVRLKAPFGPFLLSLSCDLGGAAILPAHVFDGTELASNPASVSAPVGTGPYLLKSWQRGAKLTLVRNPNYWRPGKPLLDEVVIKVMPSPNARILSLLSGEVDYIYHYWVDRNSLAPVESDKRFTVTNWGPPGDFLMVPNLREDRLANKKVREALLMAIDRDFIIKGPMKGYGKAGSSAISTGLGWANNPDVDLMKKYPYNPKKAKALLKEAGYPDGFSIRLAFDAGNPVLQAMAETVSAYWSKIGVKTELQGSDLATALDKVFKQWDFDVSLWGYTSAGDPALGISRLYVSTSIGKATYNNASGYSNPEVDRLFAEGATQTTQKDRVAPYYKVQKILADDIPTFPLVEVPNIHVARAGLKGMYDGLMQYGDWWDGVSLTK